MTGLGLMTTQEVAAVFRCTTRTLWNWRRNGLVQAVKVGRGCLYRREEIERLCGLGRWAPTTEINDQNAPCDNGV